MLVFPEALKKAQEEVDRVVGRDRQPDFEGMEGLLYLQASIKESLRWRPLVLLAISHSNSSTDEYQGMYIPKGSKIMSEQIIA
jgi:cytochrome P450